MLDDAVAVFLILGALVSWPFISMTLLREKMKTRTLNTNLTAEATALGFVSALIWPLMFPAFAVYRHITKIAEKEEEARIEMEMTKAALRAMGDDREQATIPLTSGMVSGYVNTPSSGVNNIGVGIGFQEGDIGVFVSGKWQRV